MANPNPIIPKLEKDQLTMELAHAQEKSMALRGDATFFEVMGHNPELYEWYVNRFYKELFYAERLDVKIKELLRIKLSSLHGCKFCNQGNRIEAQAAGISEEQIDQLDNFREGPFSEKEKAVLSLANEMALQNPSGKLNENLYADLKLHFTNGEILELGMIMGLLSGVAKFIFAFDLVEKEEYCPFYPKSDSGS